MAIRSIPRTIRGRARKLGQTVTQWLPDPHIPDRQVGWVTAAATEYGRDGHRSAVRWPRQDGRWEDAAVIATLSASAVIQETGQARERVLDHQAVTAADVQFSDDRGGGVETACKDDKPGLGLPKHNKKRCTAQQMLVLLGTLAHTVIGWARQWLAPHEPKVRRDGVQRLVRDVFHISGFLVRNGGGRLVAIVLTSAIGTRATP